MRERRDDDLFVIFLTKWLAQPVVSIHQYSRTIQWQILQRFMFTAAEMTSKATYAKQRH